MRVPVLNGAGQVISSVEQLGEIDRLGENVTFYDTTPIIAALGTSSVERSYLKLTGLNTSDVTWIEWGWVTWVARLCPQVAIRHSHTFGYGSETSTTMWENVGLITSAAPKPAVCLVQISSNDANDLTDAFDVWLAKYTANYIAIGRACLGAGIKPIFVIQHLRNDTAGTAVSRHLALQSWARNSLRAQLPGSYVVDTVPVTADLTSATPVSIAAMLEDTVHLDVAGAYVSALAIKPVIDALFPSTITWPAVVAGDTWATENPYGSLTQNPGMLGTGGVVTGVGASGVAADGFTVTGGSGLTVVASKVTSADGFVRQRIVWSGTASADGFIQVDASMVSGALASLVPGEMTEMAIYYTVSGLTNSRQFGCRWTPTDAGYGGAKNHRDGVGYSGTKLNNVSHTALLRPPPHVVAGAVSAGVAKFFIDLQNGVSNAGTIDIGPFAVRRVKG